MRLVGRGDCGLWSSDCCFGAAGCWLAGASDDTGSDVERRALDRVFAPLAKAERRWLARHDVALGTSAVVVATRG